MKYYKEVSALTLLALIILVAPAALASYEESIQEGTIFLVRPDNEYLSSQEPPTYLQEEDLTFFGCTEDETPLELSVVCQDTNEFAEIDAYRWGDQNCYVGSINLEQLSCTQATAQIEYVEEGENRRIEQRININKFSESLNRIVETQFSDGGWENELDTAHALYVLSQFPNLFERQIDQAINYLTTNRDEEDKCWPKEECQLSTTANILFLLEEAEIQERRIIHDARLYLEREQNYIASGAQWNAQVTDHTINLNNSFNNSCVYEYQSTTESFTLPKHPESVDRLFQPVYGETVNIACTEPVFVDLKNELGNKRFTFQGTNFTYTIPPACWTKNNEFITCDLRTTLFALNTDLSNQRISDSRNYAQSLLAPDPTAGQHVGEDWTIINDALYIKGDFSNSNDLVTALLYHQSNAGSWNRNNTYYENTYFQPTPEEKEKRPERLNDEITNRIINTGYAVLALTASGMERGAEPLRDAERYISLVEDEIAFTPSEQNLTDEAFAQEYEDNKTSILNDPKRNAMAFTVLQNNARPLLRTQPGVLHINQPNTTLDIINPTVFDLEDLDFELSEHLEPYLEINERDFVGAYSFRRIAIELTEEVESFGYLRVIHQENEYLRLPVILSSQPELRVTLPEQVTLFGASARMPFEVQKSNHTFDCSLEWETEGISSTSTFNINDASNEGTYNHPIRFPRSETENTVYNGTITCRTQGVTFKNPFATNVVRFPTQPLGVTPAALTILNQQEHPVTISNQLDEPIDVTATLREQDPYLLISNPRFALAPGETRNITIQVIPPEGDNHTTTNHLLIEAFDIEERVLLDVEVHPEPVSLVAWFILAAITLLLLITGVLGYRNQEAITTWYNEHFNKKNVKQQVEEEVARIEAEEQTSAIRNMTRIYKLQGLKDSEVREKILAEGYTEEEFNKAMSSQEPTTTQSDEEQETAQ